MSTATLNVWITDFGDACHIEDSEKWFVHITDCTGNVLKWCGKEFSFIPAKCGHVEIEIPPGCYTVFAGHSPRGAGVGQFGNRLTHVQVVRANCGDHVCVTLFSPSLWHCGTWFARAVETQIDRLQRAGIDAELARHTATVVRTFTEALQPDVYARNTLFAFEDDPPAKQKDDPPKK